MGLHFSAVNLDFEQPKLTPGAKFQTPALGLHL